MGKKKKTNRSQIPFRLNILFIFVFLLFSLLILQLGVVQILNGEEAQKEIDQTESSRAYISVPRGLMYDRFGKLILDNESTRSITYTPPKNGHSAEERLNIAKKLATFITMEEDQEALASMIRERDKKEYWYLFHAKEAAKRLSDKEKEMDSGDQYQAMLDKIKQEDYNEFDWSDPNLLNVVAIKKELDAATEFTPHIVKNEGVTEKEYAMVSEHLYELEGIDATIDWNRVSKVEDTLSTFIGNISTTDQGIPQDNEDYYLTRGYSRNDRVGTSGLEEEYEENLRGQKKVVEFTTNNNNEIVGQKTINDGQSGNDLVLTVDIELQQAVDQIVQEELEKYIESNPYENRFMEDAMVVMMDPQTGEVLAMSGAAYDKEKGEVYDEGYRTIYNTNVPGSVVKGATVLAGLDSGVISPGEHLYDSPIKIAGSRTISSYKNMGSISDIQAIEKSSNIYMSKIAIRLAGADYQAGQPLRNFDFSAFQTLRNYYSQFGLGVETGIDLPYEAPGLIGSSPNAANLLFLAFGQYDTYTTLQLAQYVSTVANDGYRVRPHLVKEIRQANGSKEKLGPVVNTIETDVLNKIEMKQDYIERVQTGFRRVITQGTASSQWSSNSHQVAAKTGTAQNMVSTDNGLKETYNLSLIGYAPYDNPEVAFAIIVPRTGTGNDQHGIHHNIGNKIINKYFELKEKRSEGQSDDNSDQSTNAQSE
ncbi:penicillin-binding protein H [Paraliobacillus ryukyuensis]|uniref:serine-type D-Ala-D-Ala carboxypeptidase n=1 Tax=Paraliobacillus ryukyuensis TaxID=200904 RepID=A0A366EG60_9BACI|nr:penicillin-binding protein 2 [Paraliobacillus ryukyuensis]RBP01384.1 cell elongation-specific peptidoglycan D,D-transpeptidase [Paraliobacillus ryukyuensis]